MPRSGELEAGSKDELETRRSSTTPTRCGSGTARAVADGRAQDDDERAVVRGRGHAQGALRGLAALLICSSGLHPRGGR